jgi:hypothetical protein
MPLSTITIGFISIVIALIWLWYTIKTIERGDQEWKDERKN